MTFQNHFDQSELCENEQFCVLEKFWAANLCCLHVLQSHPELALLQAVSPLSVRHEAQMQPLGLTQTVSKEVTLLMCPSNHASKFSHICLYKGTLKCASSVPIRTAALCYGHWTEGLQPGRIHKLPRNYGRLQAGRPCFPKILLSACVRSTLPIMVYTTPWLFDQPPKERWGPSIRYWFFFWKTEMILSSSF